MLAHVFGGSRQKQQGGTIWAEQSCPQQGGQKQRECGKELEGRHTFPVTPQGSPQPGPTTGQKVGPEPQDQLPSTHTRL